ncbi:MAG: Gfo/Idh/MocA family oxidoreductase [Anaerolineaceae bacterium]|nr:Gfo/Idh/MocA family oxidoreductase [Anaerolineaceae bacterium]
MKTKYAQVGVGSRAYMYAEAIANTYQSTSQMVGVCDRNQGRVNVMLSRLNSRGLTGVKGYVDTDFDRMITETQPDVVIVTTMDRYHEKFIVRAMELGCDVITEKPMTIDAEMCQRIVDATKATGRNVRVTFNYRYSPPRTQVKDLLMSGVIGDILSIDFHWLLDTSHGADYFRRWHRNKENSGGLMVHKATHHFDLVNWWIESFPSSVFAQGQRRYYVPETADRLGLTQRGERCHGCPESSKCPFYLDLNSAEDLRTLYLEQEAYDGYFRDRCVFSPLIDIEDSMNLVVKYDNGAIMSYSLNAYMPWEGYTISFNGSKGRLEHKAMESVYINGDDRVPGEMIGEATSIRIYPHFGASYDVEIWKADGGHGGGDDRLLKDIFDPEPETDRYRRAADWRGGAYSILTGIAANQSMASGRLINIEALVSGLKNPYID